MITGELRSKVDKIWETFWTGGLTNPLEVIEQFTYLLFIKGLDEVETKNEAEATLLGVSFEKIFDDEHQHLRWSKFSNEGNSEKMYEIVQNEVFPFIKNYMEIKNQLMQSTWEMQYLKFLHLLCYLK